MSGAKKEFVECKHCGAAWMQARPTSNTRCPKCGRQSIHVLKPKASN